MPTVLVTGMDSPVTSDSSIALRPSRIAPSTDTASPGRKRSRSPASTRSRFTSSSDPSRLIRRTIFGDKSKSARSAPLVRSRLQLQHLPKQHDDVGRTGGHLKHEHGNGKRQAQSEPPRHVANSGLGAASAETSSGSRAMPQIGHELPSGTNYGMNSAIIANKSAISCSRESLCSASFTSVSRMSSTPSVSTSFSACRQGTSGSRRP